MKAEVVVIGAGGHAKVCIELLRAMGHEVAYCISAAGGPKECLDVPVLHGDENLAMLREKGYSKLFVAIGANELRERLGSSAQAQGFQLVNAVSPQATISPTVTLGVGIAVMAGAVINADTSIGDLSIINTGACVDHDCRIGRAVHIAPQCALGGNVTVGNGAFLGIGSTAIPNVTLGDHVMVGAGAVVTSDLEPGVTALGVPAKPRPKARR